MGKEPRRKPQDPLAQEVDRLLKQLPGADPTLSGGPAAPPRRSVAAAGPRLAAPAEPSARERAGVWACIGLGVVLGIAITRWPYARDCGFPLLLYIAAGGAVMIVGGWGGMTSWKFRMPLAHVVSLVVVFWGIVLGAEQILPRIGYAKAEASWRCTTASEEQEAPGGQPAPPSDPAAPELTVQTP